ncbi:hypothetical protein TIFTF001_015812 [Ficus carica]|uniref:Peroxisomal adenine nucleotide carrier 1 n=1 Tax=Ficus carica TaxID=3494 RepID=A0AA88A6C2_FICCA|nr:hypothetical protein TIFTF001_015812 [Ficus carica]
MGVDLESVAEATSGAVGALVSTTILYPLDTCKTKYQAEVRAKNLQKYRNISDVFWEAISTRQVLSLYQGLGTKNLQSFISQFIYFYGYSFFKRMYLQKTGKKTIGAKANLIVAAAAGACTVVVTQPLDIASSKMQTSEFGKSKGLLKTLSESTWTEAFDGLAISLLLTSNPSIQLKQKLLKKKMSQTTGVTSSPEALSAFSAFLLGAVSKCVATILTYPAIRWILNYACDIMNYACEIIRVVYNIGIHNPRCKVMIQAAESDEDGKDEADKKSQKTISGALYAIWKREGPLGFFKGLEAQILKTVLSSALHLMIKEKITKTTWIILLAVRRYVFVKRVRLKKA